MDLLIDSPAEAIIKIMHFFKESGGTESVDHF
jgi:hypothetical protein